MSFCRRCRGVRSGIRGVLLCSGLLALTLSTACRREAAAPRHLVLVVFDTLRPDRMSLYGHTRETTPYLDRHSREFLLYREVKAPAPWTVPSHASLFTGRWPADHRAQWGSMRLDERFDTLAEILRREGFCTTGLSANPLVSRRTGLDQGFDDFEILRGPWSEKTATILERLPSLLAEAADCRWFLFLNLMDTHIPYNTSAHGGQYGVTDAGPVRKASTKWEISAGARPFPEPDRRRHTSAYDAAVRYLDDVARDLVTRLDDAGRLEETLLVLTSDHGDGLGSHPELGHSISVWEEQLAVPLLVRLPGARRGGEVFEDRTTLTAVLPSILDWLRVDRPAALVSSPGLERAVADPIVADYRSYFAEQNRDMNEKMAARYPELARRVRHSHVLYCDGLKLIVDADGNQRLYDLAADPHEQVDLAAAGDAGLRSCRQEYQRTLAQGRLTPFSAGPPPGFETDTAPVDLEALRALGYVQ